MKMFCSFIKRDSDFLLKFLLLTNVKIIPLAIFLICRLKYLYSCIVVYSYADTCMQNHNDTIIKTSDTVLRKIYLSLYLKGLCVRGSWRLDRTATYWPHSIGHNRVSFPFSWAAQPGAWGPVSLGAGFLYRILSPTRLIPNWLIGDLKAPTTGCWLSLPHLVSNSSDRQLSIGGLRTPFAGCWLSLPHLISNWLNFLCTDLYNSSMSTFFLWASQIALIQPIHGQGYTLLFLNRMHLLFTHVHFLFWQLGRVVGQYTTVWLSILLTRFCCFTVWH